MDGFRAPPVMDFDVGNLSEKWKKWEQRFQIYMDATCSTDDEENEKKKVAILLNLVGEKGQDIFNTFKANRATATLKDVLKLFGDYCQPQKNVIFERFKFYSAKQYPGQMMENFITEVKTLAASCEFGQEDDMVRDRLVMGIANNSLREKLMMDSKLTLKTCQEIIRTHEVNREQMKTMSQEKSSLEVSVDKIKISKIHDNNKDRQISKSKYSTQFRSQYPDRFKMIANCKKCGKQHKFGSCYAYGKRCNFCKQFNHFEACCFKKNRSKGVVKNVNELVDLNENNVEELYVASCAITKRSEKTENEWLENVLINEKCYRFKLDTGAQCNVLPTRLLVMIGNDEDLQPCQARIVTYNGSRIRAEGTIILKCKVKGKIYPIKFYIVNNNTQPILGLNTCVQLNLVKRVNNLEINNSNSSDKEVIINEYKTVFEGLGKFPGPPSKLELKENAKARVFPPRRIPKSLTHRVTMTIDKLIAKNVIKKVDGPTQWVNNVVIVEKPNSDKIRICLDPLHLNNEIKRDHFAIPTADEILSDLANMSYFSVLDLKDSFYQIVLDEESSKLCTFALSNGKYQFLRLPFGINTSAELFQKKNLEIFGKIEGVKVYIDDIVIAAKDEEMHDKILNKVLVTAKEAGVTFNPEKFQYKKKEIKLLGFVITRKGVAIDKNRIESIIKLDVPKNKKELLRFLGLVKYLTKFIPNLSKITSNLRELTKENCLWSWEETHNEEFNNLKHCLTKAPVLAHYDLNKQLVVQSDASKDGLGCVVLQEGRPIAYASRALTSCEKRYAPIERELLAIMFSVERFNYYTYGRKVIVQTDHKPLVSIFKKRFE